MILYTLVISVVLYLLAFLLLSIWGVAFMVWNSVKAYIPELGGYEYLLEYLMTISLIGFYSVIARSLLLFTLNNRINISKTLVQLITLIGGLFAIHQTLLALNPLSILKQSVSFDSLTPEQIEFLNNFEAVYNIFQSNFLFIVVGFVVLMAASTIVREYILPALTGGGDI